MRRESDLQVKITDVVPSKPLRHADVLPPVEEAIRRLQQQMWKHAGLLRDAELLKRIDLTAGMRYADALPSAQWRRREYEARSLARVARAILVSALAREESRGAHYRNDFPQRDDARFATHSHLVGDAVSFGPLIPSDRQSHAHPESPVLR
jgi:L-aspartate oxidase